MTLFQRGDGPHFRGDPIFLRLYNMTDLPWILDLVILTTFSVWPGTWHSTKHIEIEFENGI